ncbi:MAG: AAA family ATPase [Candidatus Dormibacteraceae bacterium]
MNGGEVGRLARQTNPWWRNPNWFEDDRDLQSAQHSGITYAPDVLADIEVGGLYMLRGPRRAGKSVELKRTIRQLLQTGVHPLQVIYLAVDTWRANDFGYLPMVIRGQLTAAVDQKLPRYWFLDEITGVQGDWPSQVKWLRDNTSLRPISPILSLPGSRL